MVEIIGKSPPEAGKPPIRPTPKGEVIFEGSGKSEKKGKKSEKSKKRSEYKDKPILPKDKTAEFKLSDASPDEVFSQALKYNPEFSSVLGSKPLADESLKGMLSDSIVHGDTLKEAALKIRDARVAGHIKAGEADFLLARMSNIIGEPIIVEIAGGAGWTFYDSTAPGTATSAPVQDKLKEYQDVLDNDPTMDEDPRYLRQIAEELAKSKLPSAEIKSYIAKTRIRIQQVEEQIYSSRERFSSMYTTKEEQEGLMLNPEWTVEEMLRRIEETTVLFPDTAAAQAAERRLQLMGEYFSHGQYKVDIQEYITAHPTLSADEQARLLMHGDTMYRKLSEKIVYRTGIQRAFAMIRGVGDPEKIPSSLISVGVAGLEHLMNENGGLNEIVFNRYVDIFKHAKYNPDGSLRRITSTELYRIRERVNKAIIKDIDLYKDIYQSAGYRDDHGNPRKLTSEDCKAIVRQAEYLVTLSQQDLVAMLGGKGAGEDIGGISSFASASTAEKMLAAMDINRWFFEKWTNLKPGQLVIWQNSCRLAVETDGREHLIDERLHGVQKGDVRFKELVRETFGGAPNGSQDEETLKRAKKALELQDMKKTGNHHEIHVANINEVWDKMSMSFLRDQMICAEGEKILGPLLEVYDHFSSTWRIGAHLDQLKSVYGESATGGYGDKLGLGMRLRKAGYTYITAETEHDRHEALTGVKEQLVTVAEYRPQALLGFFTDGKDAQTTTWFNAHLPSVAGLFTDEEAELHHPINQQHELSSAISRRFIAINEKLAAKGLPPIKYADGLGALSAGQFDVVQDVCTKTHTDMNRYMNLMHELSGFVRAPNMIDKLTTGKYNRILYRTQWVDDVRLRQLEQTYEKDKNGDPVRYSDIACTNPAVNGEFVKSLVLGDIRHRSEEFTPLSQVLTDRGQGDVDALVRTWRDGGTAFKTVELVNGCLTPNAETYLKNIVEVNKNVGQYSGAIYATRATAFLLGGWGKTAKTDEIYDWLFMGGLDNTSEAKRLFGPHASSMGLNELEKFIHQHDYALLSKLELVAPHAYHTVAKYLGIENKKLLGKESRLPLYIYRSRMVIAIALILIAAESAKSAAAGLSGSEKS